MKEQAQKESAFGIIKKNVYREEDKDTLREEILIEIGII
jgi:hypothetical protein